MGHATGRRHPRYQTQILWLRGASYGTTSRGSHRASARPQVEPDPSRNISISTTVTYPLGRQQLFATWLRNPTGLPTAVRQRSVRTERQHLAPLHDARHSIPFFRRPFGGCYLALWRQAGDVEARCLPILQGYWYAEGLMPVPGTRRVDETVMGCRTAPISRRSRFRCLSACQTMPADFGFRWRCPRRGEPLRSTEIFLAPQQTPFLHAPGLTAR